MTTNVNNENNNENVSIIMETAAEGRKAGENIIITLSKPEISINENNNEK